ncbi:hypothetical protein P3X46_010127 [Hevea brasiliensis]|uniref:HMA domain-containing protein n=1 Tax=Hevea brasiliensis TaxID=3981 RepID=A0ABQ9MFF2_HEVBR|nr:protein SODIUM POTASSIUM ROOT DEFECTIVE 2 [Hevea brasiliensis]KAJ9178227.1 hypothetical protein P3X46_010127 [Hevea brasiliensis]
MKKMDLFCASPASTAICSSLDHRSMVRSGTTRPIGYQKSKPYAPCSSHHLPYNPKPDYETNRKSSANKQGDFRGKSFADNDRESSTTSRAKQTGDLRRKSSADIRDLHSPTVSSSRYLLSDKVPYIDWISESNDHTSALVLDPAQRSKPGHTGSSNAPATPRGSCSLANYSRDWILEPHQTTKSRHSSSIDHSPALKSSSSARSRDQVVVLWVSIHCKGCEGKVRKHISKMEGVTSFSIDLATKKVTIIGNVTPFGVLASVSKVKNAQLWPSPATTSTASYISSTRRST